MLIGSIIDVFLAGYRILTGRFYQNFNYFHPLNLANCKLPIFGQE